MSKTINIDMYKSNQYILLVIALTTVAFLKTGCDYDQLLGEYFCSSTSCAPDETCNEMTGKCESPHQAPCDNVTCPDDHICDEKTGECFNPHQSSCECGENEICIEGQCVADQCMDKHCDSGQVCQPLTGECECPEEMIFDDDYIHCAYTIGSAEDFYKFAQRNDDMMDKHYLLTSDITLTAETWNNAITFAGFLNGKDHTITLDTSITCGKSSEACGLFSVIFNGKITHLTVIAQNLLNSTVDGSAGILAGTILGSESHLNDITCQGSVSAQYVGGCIGKYYAGRLSHITSQTLVTAICSSPDRDTHAYAGGMIGQVVSVGKCHATLSSLNIEDTEIKNECHTNTVYLGGIVGSASDIFIEHSSINRLHLDARQAFGGGIFGLLENNEDTGNCRIGTEKAIIETMSSGNHSLTSAGIAGILLLEGNPKVSFAQLHLSNLELQGDTASGVIGSVTFYEIPFEVDIRISDVSMIESKITGKTYAAGLIGDHLLFENSIKNCIEIEDCKTCQEVKCFQTQVCKNMNDTTTACRECRADCYRDLFRNLKNYQFNIDKVHASDALISLVPSQNQEMACAGGLFASLLISPHTSANVIFKITDIDIQMEMNARFLANMPNYMGSVAGFFHQTSAGNNENLLFFLQRGIFNIKAVINYNHTGIVSRVTNAAGGLFGLLETGRLESSNSTIQLNDLAVNGRIDAPNGILHGGYIGHLKSDETQNKTSHYLNIINGYSTVYLPQSPLPCTRRSIIGTLTPLANLPDIAAGIPYTSSLYTLKALKDRPILDIMEGVKDCNNDVDKPVLTRPFYIDNDGVAYTNSQTYKTHLFEILNGQNTEPTWENQIFPIQINDLEEQNITLPVPIIQLPDL